VSEVSVPLSPRERLVGALTDAGYGAAWTLAKTVPDALLRPVFATAAGLAVYRRGRGVVQLSRNLARVTGRDPDIGLADPAMRRLVGQAMSSYARYWLETFRLPVMNLETVLAGTTTTGVEKLWAARDRGPVVVALPHSGNWDIAGVWLLSRGCRFTTVVERLKPESLFERFVRYRESLGMEVIALSGTAESPSALLRQRLQDGGMVCLVADRDLSGGGVKVDFFGAPARMPAGPALLAAATGAQLLPVHLYFQGTGWGQEIGDPIDLGAGRLRDQVSWGTQQLANFFASRIRQHPADWHMLQRLWEADFSVPPSSDSRVV